MGISVKTGFYLDFTLHLFKSDGLRITINNGFILDILGLKSKHGMIFCVKYISSQRVWLITESGDITIIITLVHYTMNGKNYTDQAIQL